VWHVAAHRRASLSLLRARSRYKYSASCSRYVAYLVDIKSFGFYYRFSYYRFRTVEVAMASGGDSAARSRPVPAPDPVREEIAHVCSSAAFANARRSSSLLRFTAEHALNGKASILKEYTVGVEVLGRPPSFDPRLDGIVRVEASRLRARLREYYRDEGRHDAIAVDFPKGAYVPVFRWREPAGSDTTGPGLAPSATHWRRIQIGIASGLFLIGAAMAWRSWDRWFGGPGRIQSVAVLPFRNLSPNPEQQYFADGITEELITTLARIKAWRVTSWTSVMAHKSSGKPAREIASELGVQALLEGAFQRSSERVYITAKLVETSTGRIRWAKSYHRDIRDASTLNDELARAIAADMQAAFPLSEQGRLSRSRQVEPAAHDAYLQGRFYQLKETEHDAKTAIGWFEEAVRIDPGYAPAYAALAHTYNTTAQISGQPSLMEQTRKYAQKALEIDPGVAEAHAMLGAVKTLYEWDFAGAERELNIALEINPSSADALVYYAVLLEALGSAQEAVAMAKRAVEIDPKNPTRRDTLGFRYYFARMYDAATAQFRQASRQYPSGWVAHLGLGSVYAAEGTYKDAIDELKKAVDMSGGAEEVRAALANAYAKAGKRPEALDILGNLLGGSKIVSPMYMAEIYVSLGARDRAFESLAKAYAQRSYHLAFLKVDPVYDSVRSDPRFRDLLLRIGLRP
jgi:TolB-like protein/Tfp pilus assembly protein PilF